MATSPYKDLLQLDDSALKEETAATRKALFDLRCKRATRQLEKSHLFRQTRIKLARLLTIQQQRRQANPPTSPSPH